MLLVTTPDTPGGAATVQPISIAGCTTWVLDELCGEDGVDRFCANIAGCNPIGQVTIADVSPTHRMVVEARLRAEAPRMAMRWEMDAPDETGTGIEGPNPQDVSGTVRSYLDAVYANDPARHARLVSAFEALWSDSGEVPA